jgi:hypothetical protein
MIKNNLSIYLLVIVCACNTNKSQNTKNLAVNSEGVWVNSVTDSFLNKILGGGEGTIRGFDLGDSISKVKTHEDLELFEEESNVLSYTFETEDSEVVDVLYKHEGDILNEVQLDIYLNSDSVTKEISKGLSLYFTQKYGQPKIDIGKPTWRISSTQLVEVKNITSNLDKGLQINFKKTN